MTWTDPRTWVDDEVVYNADLQEQIRDNLKTLGDSRVAFGDASYWTAASSNPDLKSGTWTGRYHQYGKTVIGTIRLKFAGDTTFGSGVWQFKLPAVPLLTERYAIGEAFLNDASGGQQTGNVVMINGEADLIRVEIQNIGKANATTPWTWANNDELYLSFHYEAA